MIVRTELKHEAKVYRAMVELQHDAWLPQMPRITRAHRKVKHRREWWKPTMPTVFFAKVDPLDVMHLDYMPYFRGILRRWSGDVIIFDEADLLAFRRRIDAENREILRMGKLAEPKPPQVRASKPSRRIKRPGVKPARASEDLARYTDRIIKAEQTPPCKTGADVVTGYADRMCPDPQAT